MFLCFCLHDVPMLVSNRPTLLPFSLAVPLSSFLLLINFHFLKENYNFHSGTRVP